MRGRTVPEATLSFLSGKSHRTITFRWLFALLIQIETLEAINTSAGVYQLLLGEERVTLRANVNYDILPLVEPFSMILPQSAANGRLLVVGWIPCFMLFHLFTDMFTYLQQS